MEHQALVNIDSRKHDFAHCFGGITLTIHDLAKIGRLYLNNGMRDGRRIVSDDWVRQTADCDTSWSNSGPTRLPVTIDQLGSSWHE